jgi:hypothetical protein
MHTDLSPGPSYLFPVYPTVATVSFSAYHVEPDYHTSHSRLSTAPLGPWDSELGGRDGDGAGGMRPVRRQTVCADIPHFPVRNFDGLTDGLTIVEFLAGEPRLVMLS